MFLEIIFTSILFISLLGISLILLRKIPVLVGLPKTKTEISRKSFVAIIKNGIAKLPGAGKIDYELYLQKMLSKVRVLTLKAEGKTGSWLERLRKRRNGHNHDDGYWEELKKTKKGN